MLLSFALAVASLQDAGDHIVIIAPRPITKEGATIPRTILFTTRDAKGKETVGSRLATRAELIAKGAVPEFLPHDLDPALTLTIPVRTLLASAVARNALAMTKDEMASIPLAIEVLKSLDAEYDNDPKAKERKSIYRQRIDATLREAFGKKSERMREIMIRFDGLPVALEEPLRRMELGVSEPQVKALWKKVDAWRAAQRWRYDDPMANRDNLAWDEIKGVNSRAYRELDRRAALEEAELLRGLEPEHRANWLRMIGAPPGFPRPEPWHHTLTVN